MNLTFRFILFSNFQIQKVSFEEIKNLLITKFGPRVILSENLQPLMPYVTVPKEKLADICLELHDNEETYFDFLSCQTGIENDKDKCNYVKSWIELNPGTAYRLFPAFVR